MEKNVLIIGHGIVGTNLLNELQDLHPDIVDKYEIEVNTIRNVHYDLGIICVDTPLNENGELNIEEVKNSLNEYNCEIFCIKSTCPVGTTEKLAKESGKRIVYSPEYFGNTKQSLNYSFDYTILGGNRSDCNEVIQILLPCYDGRHSFRVVDSKLAEMVKFMENSFLATKVSFCQSFFLACEKENLDYNELRELFILDPRVNPSHTFVYKDKPYWDSHCLNKDVPAIANQYDITLLKDVIDFNNNQKK